MTTPADTARRAILGIPYDPGKKPERHLLVQAFEEQSIVANAVNTGSIVKDTKANLDLVTAAPEDQMAWVVGDATPANNGIYENTGTASVTVWTRRADIPQGVIPMTDVGAGTANAIVTTTPLAVPATLKALFILFPFEANTGAVTLANNGAAAKPLKDVAGADLLPGALSATQPVLLAEETTRWRMFNDYASAANQELARLWANGAEDVEPDPVDHAGQYSAMHWRNKAEDQAIYSEEWAQSAALITVPAGGNGTTDRSSKWHAEKAELASEIASGAMSAIVLAENTFSTKATAEAWAPAAAPDFIRIAFFDSDKVPGSGAVYRNNGTTTGDLVITLDDAVTDVGYDIASMPVTASMLGAKGAATDDTAAIEALLSRDFPHVVIDGVYDTDGDHEITTDGKLVEFLPASELRLRAPVGTVTASYPVIKVAADDVSIRDPKIDGQSHTGYQQSIGIQLGADTGDRCKRPRVFGGRIRNLGQLGVKAIRCIDDLVDGTTFENIRTTGAGENGDGAYAAACHRSIRRNIRSINCKRDAVVMTYTGGINCTDFVIDGVYADSLLDSPSAAVWVEMTGARDPRGIVTNIQANDCQYGVVMSDLNSQILVSNLKAIGNRISTAATGNVYGALIRSGRLDNWLIDRYGTALELEPGCEYQFAMSSESGPFTNGEVVTGGTSGAVGTLRFQHVEIFITGSTYEYELGETVTGGTSGATGTLVDFFANVLRIVPISGDFQPAETITGDASAAARTSSTVTRRVYVGATDDVFTAGETITGGTSGSTAVIAAPFQTEIAVGPGTLSNCSAEAIMVAAATTPARLSLTGIRGNVQSHGLRFNLSAGQRLRKAIVKDVALKNVTSAGIGFRVTTAGVIDEMIVDGLDLSEWVGDGNVSSITAGIVTRFIGGNNPGLQGSTGVPVDLTANTTLTGLQAGAMCHNNGAAASRTHILPPAKKGSRSLSFAAVHATHVMNLDPSGAETIKGGGAGKYLILDPGERVTLQPYTDGNWVVASSIGWSGDFEP